MGNKVRYKVIDNKRLNVYLTKTDLQKENVTIEDIVVGNEKSVVKIKKIFKVVSKLAHFNTGNRLLNIVLMPVIDGDLIISAGFSESEDRAVSKAVFVFENFENLLDACLEIKRYIILSSLYQMSKKYYLIIKSFELNSCQFENLCAIIAEYGEKCDCSILFVTEHGKLLLKENVTGKLLKLFF